MAFWATYPKIFIRLAALTAWLIVVSSCSGTGSSDSAAGDASSDKICPVTIQTTTPSATACPSPSSSTSIPECTTDGEIGCVTTSAFRAAKMSNFTASSVVSGTTIAGVAGSITDHGSWNLQNSFPGAGYYSGVSNAPTAGLIKSGTTLIGVNGSYPSVIYPLTGADSTADLDLATFDAKIKSAASFEWFAPDGTRYSNAGDADLIASNIGSGVTIFGLTGTRPLPPDAWDLRVGVQVGTVTGKLKVSCRNGITSSVYNHDGTATSIPNGGVNSGTSFDWWDSIDDYNNGSTSNVPTNYPSGWSSTYSCGGIESLSGDSNVWKDMTSSVCDSAADNCHYKDKISGLEWSEALGPLPSWSHAIDVCDLVNFDGYADWRLPTQKEAMEAYNHGIRSAALAATHWISNTQLNNYLFWTATSYSNATDRAWIFDYARGQMTSAVTKSTSGYYALCVR